MSGNYSFINDESFGYLNFEFVLNFNIRICQINFIIMDSSKIKTAIERFLAEDLGSGDITTDSLIPPGESGEAEFVAKAAFVVAGMASVAAEVFTTQNPAVRIIAAAPDGAAAAPGDIILRVSGPTADLFKAERVALNLGQRLCGIATLTARFVELVKPLPVRIVDTRKTTPGLRLFEKYAVIAGGGHNHRFDLGDGIIIKDNHIAACGSISKAVALLRQQKSKDLKIEVEAENIEQVRECLDSGVEIIMLDNMDTETMRRAVELAKGRALLEASGGVTLANVREIAETGVDYISIGALTHSAPAVDISMRYKERTED